MRAFEEKELFGGVCLVLPSSVDIFKLSGAKPLSRYDKCVNSSF